MNIIDGRTRNKKDIKEKNRQRIIQFFKDNPTATRQECADTLGLSYYTVINHCNCIKND